MDQKRLFAAIAISIGILLLFDLYNRPAREAQQVRQQQVEAAGQQAPAPGPGRPAPHADGRRPRRRRAARARGAAARGQGRACRARCRSAARASTIWCCATTARPPSPNSPLVRMLAPRDGGAPYYAQWGWTAADGRTAVPDNDTDWQAEGGRLAPGSPVTLRWDNGQGQVFEIALSLDENFMVTAEQRVRNNAAEPVSVLPWVRVRRERTPPTEGWAVLHEGFTGVLNGRLQRGDLLGAPRTRRPSARASPSSRRSTGGWAGFTDKYWLTALAPVDQSARVRATYRATQEPGPRGPRTVGRWTSRRRGAMHGAGRRHRRRPGDAPLRRRQGGEPARRLWRPATASRTSTRRSISAGSTS